MSAPRYTDSEQQKCNNVPDRGQLATTWACLYKAFQGLCDFTQTKNKQKFDLGLSVCIADLVSFS